MSSDQAAADPFRELKVPRVAPEGLLQGLEGQVRLLDLHVRLSQHHVGLHVWLLLHQLLIALGICLGVLAVPKVDVRHGDPAEIFVAGRDEPACASGRRRGMAQRRPRAAARAVA